jgi:polyhydroxyalkanoate synthesis regulator phasin
MAVQTTVEQQIDHTKEVIKMAEEQLGLVNRQEPQTTEENYTNAQLQLEEAYSELERLSNSATPEQRYQIERTRQQLQQIQEQMVLKMK